MNIVHDLIAAEPAPPMRFWRYYLPVLGLAAAFFILFPEVDLRVSGLFYDAARRLWPHARETSAQDWRVALNVVAWGVLAVTLVVSAWQFFSRGAESGPPARVKAARAMLFTALCYALGPGLIVNLGFKNNWGRARPNAVAEFGGGRIYSHPFRPTDQCGRNCSFVSGEGSMGFISASPALLLDGGARWAMIGGGIVLGVALGGIRVIQGAHFVSDVVFSGMAAWFAIWLAYGLVYRNWVLRWLNRPPDAAVSR